MENAAEWSAVKRLPQTKPLPRLELCMKSDNVWKVNPSFGKLCDPQGNPCRFCSLLHVRISPWVIFYRVWSLRWGQSDTKIFEPAGISLDDGTVKPPAFKLLLAGRWTGAVEKVINHATAQVRKWEFTILVEKIRVFRRREPETPTAGDAGLPLQEEIKGKWLEATIILTQNWILLKGTGSNNV